MIQPFNKLSLVLGAGSACPYGFPTNNNLFKNLLQALSTPSSDLYQLLLKSETQVYFEFHDIELVVQSLKRSRVITIDQFLANNPRYASMLKFCVAYQLLRCESNEDAHYLQNEDWIGELVRSYYGIDYDVALTKQLIVITFNYTREFERLFYESVYHIFGEDNKKADAIFKNVHIHHMYGSFGHCNELGPDSNFLKYGERTYLSAHQVSLAASRIKVISETRIDMVNPLIKNLLNSDKIYFFGFGFDAINFQRLGINLDIYTGDAWTSTFKMSEERLAYLKSSFPKIKRFCEHYAQEEDTIENLIKRELHKSPATKYAARVPKTNNKTKFWNQDERFSVTRW